ncbi:MAG: hypothetical protein FWF99_05585 [Desulfovibrionaceae bacterium]|nr:hypothetical protein [Desulfovibrionaceae bacterium]
MTQVNLQTGVVQTNPLDPAQGVQSPSPATGPNPQVVPPATSQSGGIPDSVSKDIPILADPKFSGLSLEQLVQALGMEGRQTAVKAGLESIEAKKVEIKELNDKKAEEIQNQLEALKNKQKLEPFLKAFKYVGIALGAIASVASIAVGAALIATGAGSFAGAMLIAGGTIGLAMTANSIVSEATGGKVSIAAGVAELCKAMGISEEAAGWIGMGVEIGISLVGAGLCVVGGLASSGAAIAQVSATTVSKVATATTTIANVASGGVQIASGGTRIANSVYDYQIAQAKAELKDLEAIVLQIMQAQETEKDFLESVMERTQSLLADVMDIIKEASDASTAMLTIGTPNMA